MSDPRSEERRGQIGVLERWWEEHSELDHLVGGLEAALESGSAARASEALEDLIEALTSHLSVEEDVYFPLLESLLPESAATVREARLTHRDLLGEFDRLRDQLAASDLYTARSTLERLLWRFRDHERREAQLIADLRGR
jgi:hemerythrin-like domain-containing protein